MINHLTDYSGKSKTQMTPKKSNTSSKDMQYKSKPISVCDHRHQSWFWIWSEWNWGGDDDWAD